MWFMTMVIVFIPGIGSFQPNEGLQQIQAIQNDQPVFLREYVTGLSQKLPPEKKKNDSNNCSKFPMIFGYFFGEEVLAPGQKMFDSLAENLNAMVINIF